MQRGSPVVVALDLDVVPAGRADAHAQRLQHRLLGGEPHGVALDGVATAIGVLALAGREGLLSANATAGRQATIPVTVMNTGTAPAENVTLSGNAPDGWKIEFNPKTIARIAPNKKQEVQALLTPSDKAIAGDYVTGMTASAKGETGTANFRITVTTATVWGVAGVGIIGAALLIMVGAVARFGRR